MSTSTARSIRPSAVVPVTPIPHLSGRQPASPFIKWVGGKGKLLTQLSPLMPPGAHLMRHVEPFIGGGAMFFARRPERALLCDINPDLIGTYTAVRDNLDAVIRSLQALARDHNADNYYRVRDRYNEQDRAARTARAAMFIYLNKTCFNGLHRVNRKGEFNVPAGRYDDPRILNADALRACSAQLQAADLRCQGFESLLETAKPGDFIYFDPPYAPVSTTANFTSYAQTGFGRDDQVRLRDVYRELDRRGCRLMLSNSDVPFIRDIYAEYKIDVVAAPRAINCDAKSRGKVTEVVVRNYA